MEVLGIIDKVFNIVNDMFDVAFLWLGLLVILSYPFYFLFKSIEKLSQPKKQDNQKENHGGEILSHTIILLIVATVIGFLWLVPELTRFKWPNLGWLPTMIRCVGIAIIFRFFAYYFGHDYGEKRWSYSWFGHATVIFFGLIVDRFMGILLISIPLIAIYYFVLFRLALIIMPVSNPEDHAEKWKRFSVLASYTWGIQAPMYVVDGHAWKKLEARIQGDFTWDFSDFSIPLIDKLKRPGLVWTPAHQVAAITGGTRFKRVEEPGVTFTSRLERPQQIFDLRMQLRTNEIDVVSKDGISFKARVFTAFRLDPETWDKETYDELRLINTLLRGANKPSYTQGSFPYSNLRVQAALGVTSTNTNAGDITLYWDQWALNIIEDQARKVISQKNLGELWRPAQDEKGANALNQIAGEIKNNIFLEFRSVGILLIVARIVNFSFPSDDGQADEISQQQLATWGSEWEGKRTRILAEAEAESERAQQEARAYAESLLLNSIAEGLQKTQEMDPRLPRYVIAMRFLSALQDYIYKKPTSGEQAAEYEKKVNELHNYLKEWQDQFFPGQSKEKLP